ncbi:hypothetical protein [Polynucleobacter necessarius]|uniref:PDC sensor domain-containing protein n=1 Tax=Polynucleobacter necessarius TaxID=576610 RepID=UPI000E099A00|nr:hypothetical protein [Polynucleobacter necessarius]
MTISYELSSNIRRNSRIILVTAFILAIIFCVNASLSAYLLRQNSIDNHSEELSNLTVILAEHTAQTIFLANTALNSIMDTIQLERISTEKAFREFATSKKRFELLKDRTQSNSVLDVSTFVADDGKVLNFSRSFPAPDINLADRDYFKYLSANNDQFTYCSLPVRNKGNGKWVFYLAKRVNGLNNQFLGLVLVGFQQRSFPLYMSVLVKI